MLRENTRLSELLKNARQSYSGSFGVEADNIPWWVIRDIEKADTPQLTLFPSELDEIVRDYDPNLLENLRKSSSVKGLHSGEVRYAQTEPDGFPVYISIEKGREPKRAGMCFTVHYNSSDDVHSYWFVSDASALLVPPEMKPPEKEWLESHTAPRIPFRQEDWSYPRLEEHCLLPENAYLAVDGDLHKGWKKILMPQESNRGEQLQRGTMAMPGVAYGYGDTIVYARPPLAIPQTHSLLKNLVTWNLMPKVNLALALEFDRMMQSGTRHFK